MIIKEEILEIQPKFNELIATTQFFTEEGKEKMNTNPLFSEWAKNKLYFYKAFGNKCIYELEEEVNFSLDYSQQLSMLDTFIHSIQSWRETIRNDDYRKKMKDFVHFLKDQNIEGFFNNIVCYSYNDYNVYQGMKLCKAFRYFFPEDAKDELQYWQQKASELIQKNKINGKLCLSIHPLDYLTVSVNNHNWRSCHALDGEYCAGNLDYMTDSSTIVCYLKADNDQPLIEANEFVWNSKKWRMLYHFNKDYTMAFLNKQYPFSNISLERRVSRMIGTVINDETWLKRTGSYTTFNQLRNSYNDMNTHLPDVYAFIRNELVKIEDFITMKHKPLHFNDLLHSSCFLPSIKCNTDYDIEHFKKNKVSIGGETKCCICGRAHLARPDMFVCDTCARKYTKKMPENVVCCDACGTWIDLNHDEYHEEDGEAILCEHCHSEMVWDNKEQCWVYKYRKE